jgi:hypothetical protein
MNPISIKTPHPDAICICHRIVYPQFSLARKTPQEGEKVVEIDGLIVP